MATKILKIPSNQSGPFTSTNNKVDITIPDYMSYIDAMKTCVLINMKFVDGTGNPTGELFDGALNDGLDIRCLLKTVTLSSSKNGVLEQIPALNVLKMNLDQTQRDFEDDNALVYMGFQSGADYHTHNVTKDKNNATTERLGTFIQKNNSGTTLSKAETYLKIPLSSIFGICNMKQFPVNLFGDVRISLEFEDDVKIIKHLFKYTQHRDIAIPNSGFTAGSATNVVKIPANDSLPFYVGEPVTIIQNNASAAVNDRIITNLAYDDTSTTKTVDVTFSGAAVTFADDETNKVQQRVTVADAGGTAGAALDNFNITYSISDVDVQVYQYTLGDSQKAKLNSNMKKGISLGFMTYSLERVNLPTITKGQQFTRQIDLEPGVVNVFAMMPKQFDTDDQAQPLFSINDGFSNYRYRLNGIDTTGSSDVVPYQSLYYDRLMATLSNGYLKIKNLRLSAGKAPENTNTDNSAIDSPATDASVKSYMMATPIPKSDSNQILQLKMLKKNDSVQSAGSTILHVWKQVQKDLKLSQGGIQVQ